MVSYVVEDIKFCVILWKVFLFLYQYRLDVFTTQHYIFYLNTFVKLSSVKMGWWSYRRGYPLCKLMTFTLTALFCCRLSLNAWYSNVWQEGLAYQHLLDGRELLSFYLYMQQRFSQFISIIYAGVNLFYQAK